MNMFSIGWNVYHRLNRAAIFCKKENFHQKGLAGYFLLAGHKE